MDDRQIHRLHDDDLSPEEKAAVEKELAASPELGKKLEGLREVGVVLRAARTDEEPIDSEALWKAIEARTTSPAAVSPAAATSAESSADDSPSVRPALRVIEGAGRPAVEDPRARRRRQIGIAVGAFAIAAAALFIVYGPPSGEPDTVAELTPPETTAPVPDEALPEEPVAVAATDYTEVLAVDFGTNVGTIFAVEGEGGQRYAVVWLDDVLKNDEMEPSPEAEAVPD